MFVPIAEYNSLCSVTINRDLVNCRTVCVSMEHDSNTGIAQCFADSVLVDVSNILADGFATRLAGGPGLGRKSEPFFE